MAEQMIQIVDGPGKFDLMEALFSGDFQNRKPITLRTKEESEDKKFYRYSTINEVQINVIKRKGGSGELWFFWGYAQMQSGRATEEIECLFDTQKREGWLRVIPNQR